MNYRRELSRFHHMCPVSMKGVGNLGNFAINIDFLKCTQNSDDRELLSFALTAVNLFNILKL